MPCNLNQRQIPTAVILKVCVTEVQMPGYQHKDSAPAGLGQGPGICLCNKASQGMQMWVVLGPHLEKQ